MLRLIAYFGSSSSGFDNVSDIVWLKSSIGLISARTSTKPAIDGISYIPSDSLAPAIRKLAFKENRAFGVIDIRGEIPRGRASELGIYFNDTRHVNTWETLINGVSITLALIGKTKLDGMSDSLHQ